MKIVLKSVLGLMAAAALWAVPASAAQIVNPTALQSLLVSRTLYTEGFKTTKTRYDHVRLSKNGTATTDYVVMKHSHGFHTVPQTGRVYGTWTVQGSNVCLQWRGSSDYLAQGTQGGCFRIERLPGSEFSTPNYRATNVASGSYWDFRVIN